MTTIGERDKLVAFQRRTVTENDLGGEDETSWPEIEKAWAAIRFGTGQERRQAAVEGASQAATFAVESTTALRTVSPADRIEYNGAWDITSIAEVGLNRELHFTATAAKG